MNCTKNRLLYLSGLFFLLILISPIIFPHSTHAQNQTPNHPDEPIKLIFIHHSTGENWLSDGNGDLGVALGNNNYFVSDTNYGWGPNSIGDATDYHNWYDWFVGPESSIYLSALYNESGQNSSYARTLSDPGGENRIIVFKSCFPNSDLGGNPDDPPQDGEWYTISHSKFVYNQLLDYFGTRPDKLFIAITPPPLLNRDSAENAREFSRWLVDDWLVENNYPLDNVAVWDFHNMLTHPDNHHRFQGGSIDHTIFNGNGTLYYDSDGDEHPNQTGNQKATEEFVSMLNFFYNQWVTTAPESPPTNILVNPSTESEDEVSEAKSYPESPPNGTSIPGTIDNFETGPPVGTNGWESYWDGSTESTLSCSVDSNVSKAGSSSLRIDFHIEPDGWGTCPLFYDSPPFFDHALGVSFDYKAGSQGLLFNFDAYGGNPESRSTYHFTVETVPESIDDWVHYELHWDQIVRVDWEENPGIPINPTAINGFAFGFSTSTDSPNSGTIWIDNFSLITTDNQHQHEGDQSATDSIPNQILQADESMEILETPEENGVSTDPGDENNNRRICPGSTGMIVFSLIGSFFLQQDKWRQKRGQ